MNKTKLYMMGISISLAMALTGCGGTDTNTNQAGVKTLSSSVALETKAYENIENPINLKLVNIEETNATLEFDGFSDQATFDEAVGVAIAYAKIDEDEEIDENVSKEFWEKVHYGWGIKTLATENDANRTQITVTDLKPNQRYAFRIASLYNDENIAVGLYSGTGSWSEIVTQGKTLAGIPSPEITVKSACLYDNESCKWVEGAKIEWTLPEMLDSVNIYREELNEDNSTIEGSLITVETGLNCIYCYDDTDVTVGHTYRYLVEGYDSQTGIHSDKNATAIITIKEQ